MTKQFQQNMHLRTLLGMTLLMVLFLALTPVNAKTVLSSSTSQQDRKVTGIVCDKNNEPLVGVSVFLPGTKTGTITDVDGKFSLSVSKGQTLVFSFIGFENQMLEATDNMKVILLEDMMALDKSVVVGYAVQKKVNLTGAVAVVDSEDLKNMPVNSAVQSLQGKAPGLTIIDAGGAPGAERISMNIRGIGTIGNCSPLVIVDGVISQMSSINSNDIQSISVLKDAASAAIYGSRSANGVILITTKSGKGAPSITYDNQFSFKDFTALPKPLHAADVARYHNLAYQMDGRDIPRYTDEEIRMFETGEDPVNYPNTDWMGLALQGSGFSHSHNLAISGSSQSIKYRISGSYMKDNSLMKNTNYSKGTLRANIESKVGEHFTVGMNSSLIYGLKKEPTWAEYGSYNADWMMNWIMSLSPTLPAVDPETGEYVAVWWQTLNPLNHIENGGPKTNKVLNYLEKLYASVDIIDGLKLDLSASMTGTLAKEHLFKKQLTYYGGGKDYPAFVSDSHSLANTTMLQALLTYDFSLNNVHNFHFLAGASAEMGHNEFSYVRGDKIPSNETGEIDAAGTTKQEKGRGSSADSRVASGFLRMNYDFKGRYLFEANARMDATSKFAANVRKGIFPSFSAGWRISEEPWMKGISSLDNLKLRASWGRLGNAPIGEYQFLSKIVPTTGYPFGGSLVQGMTPGGPVNPALTWETTQELNLGLDLSMWNGMLDLSLEYYDKLTYDIITTVPVSEIYGDNAPFTNDAQMSNKGVELVVSHSNIIADDLHYSITANMSYNKNQVKKYATPSVGSQLYKEGYEWGTYYGYEWSGKFYQTEDDLLNGPHQVGKPEKLGDLLFVDQNGDNEINQEDRIPLGTRNPKFTFGLNFGLEWKGIDFSAFFQGVTGSKQFLPWNMIWPFNDEIWQPIYEHQLDFWTPQNPDASMPRLTAGPNVHNKVLSSYTVRDASYLRLKTVELGYTLPSSWMKKVNIEKLRFYVSGRNLFTISNTFDAYDPEVNGSEGYALPALKSINFGLNLTF